VQDFDQLASDLSVDHAEVVNDYRAEHSISVANEDGEASTHGLRHAMVHYRSLYDGLLVTQEPREQHPREETH
jgi:hypothetical protein